MQKKKPVPIDADGAMVTRRDIERAFAAKPVDPYKQVLHRKHFYVIDRRIPLQQVQSVHLRCADWEIRTDGTVQIFVLHEWKVLNWFVELAKKGDLASLTAAEFLGLQEDYQAFQARVIPVLTNGPCWNRTSLPSLEELSLLQSKVREHIERFLALGDAGEFTFTEFTPTLLIQRDPKDRRRLVVHEFVPHLDVRGMLYLFATLLRHVRLPIEQCPRCKQMFLKPRKDAEHCSRECQYLYYAQKKRGDRPPGKRGRPRKHPELQQTHTTKATKKKGAKSHGTKTR
jgi:hypothetical protein